MTITINRLAIFAVAAFMISVMTPSANAQSTSTSDDGDKIISVPKRYVSPEGVAHQAPAASAQWIGIGREIGTAINEGLGAVVDKAEKFGTTKVGTFVMFMVAWKIIGRDVLGVVLGVPFLIAGWGVILYLCRRMFFGYRVIDRVEGRTKFYKDAPAMKFNSGDMKGLTGAALIISAVAFTLVMILEVIF
jgi:hypothetical protein